MADGVEGDQRECHVAALDDESTTTAELLQAHLPTSKVVKAFNHIPWSQILEHAKRAGTPGRRAPGVLSDDADAAATVAQVVDTIGFDPVVVTPLSEGWRVQRDTPAYVSVCTADELRTAMADAKRHRDM